MKTNSRFPKGLCILMIFGFIGLNMDAEVRLFSGKNPVSYNLPSWKKRAVPAIAAEMLDSDLEMVTGVKPIHTDRSSAKIKIYNIATSSPDEKKELKNVGIDVDCLTKLKDGFALKANHGSLFVAGSDDRGTAYGMLEVSRLTGVSPWVWWNDATPERKSNISVPDNYSTLQAPSVEFRGIFLNDEDWTLQPWSWQTFEKGNPQGMIGAKTYKEIFKLLIRLRANAIWPGMHGITTPFYMVPGAKEVADSCGIVIGTSHCEPLMRNNVGEWKEKERGPYNYITNGDNVRTYWTERLEEAGSYENMYTIGMRGIHDGHMEGVNTMEEKVSALQKVINDQRKLLSKYVDPDVESIPQAFVPYKEVLEIMENGVDVPEDVTLIWCDDNYGYMTRLSDTGQQKRSGGAGVYYHLSYWGRPHDYMWLGSTQPGLVYSEMKEAYDNNARKIWIVNVHDMKTSSYNLELFLDMAWNIDAIRSDEIHNHLFNWLCREFGEDAGKKLLPVMHEYYRLCGIRRPDHMGWTQVELDNRKAYPRGRSHVIDTQFSFKEFGNEADRYLNAYKSIAESVSIIEEEIPADKRDNYFAQIKYPVLGATAMAEKMLEAQRARSYAVGQCDNSLWGRDSIMLGACARSQNAYQRIRQLTRFYNDSLAGGRWKHAMCDNPRDLNVFNAPVLPVGLTESECRTYSSQPLLSTVSSDTDGATAINAYEYISSSSKPVSVSMLGHSMKAIRLQKGESVSYDFKIQNDGDVRVLTALLPTQPVDTGDIRVSISIDGNEPQIISYREKGRTDTWKENVLRNQARLSSVHNLKAGVHTISIKALDNHVILDQIMIDPDTHRQHYVIPTNI